MSVDALVFWIFVFAWVAVLGFIGFALVPRIVREGTRIGKRILALANDSTLSLQIAKAERDVIRMRVALNRLPGLVSRAQAAGGLIRATPLVPPALADAVIRARRTLRAFHG
jgi:hypothetical protein